MNDEISLSSSATSINQSDDEFATSISNELNNFVQTSMKKMYEDRYEKLDSQINGVLSSLNVINHRINSMQNDVEKSLYFN